MILFIAIILIKGKCNWKSWGTVTYMFWPQKTENSNALDVNASDYLFFELFGQNGSFQYKYQYKDRKAKRTISPLYKLF